MKIPRRRDLPPARTPNRPGRKQQSPDWGEIAHGTVGWEDGGEHFNIEDEGVPLLKVTLFQGFNTETQGPNSNPSRARGRQVLARFDGRASNIFDDGELVVMARPAGLEGAPGSYFVLGSAMPDPKWMPNRQSGEKVFFGPKDSFIRIKEDGTIFAFCKSGDADTGKPVQLELGPDGYRVNHPHGESYCDVDGFGMSHSSGAKFSGGALGGMPSPLDAFSSFLNLSAAILRVDCVAMTLGPLGGQDNLLKQTPILSFLGEVHGALSALQSSVSAVGALAAAATPLPPGTVFVAAATAATAALTASTAAVAAVASGLVTCSVTAPTNSCTMS